MHSKVAVGLVIAASCLLSSHTKMALFNLHSLPGKSIHQVIHQQVHTKPHKHNSTCSSDVSYQITVRNPILFILTVDGVH